jgi:hypothetical protein
MLGESLSSICIMSSAHQLVGRVMVAIIRKGLQRTSLVVDPDSLNTRIANIECWLLAHRTMFKLPSPSMM